MEVIGHYKPLKNEDLDSCNTAGEDSTLPPKTNKGRYSKESGNHLSQSL